MFRRNLTQTSEGRAAAAYLKKRGLSEETVQTLKIGYAMNSWDALRGAFQSKGVTPPLLEKAGLVLPGKKPGEFYDRFRGRVIFPIFSLTGKVVAFGGRDVINAEPKYLNSPDTPLYSKGKLLYGLNFSKDAVREAGEAILVEGYTDFSALFQAGIKNVVASLGTALTPAQVSLLGRQAREAVLVFDADESGRKAAQRSLELFLDEGLSAKVASLPAGFDPDSFVRREKAAGFRRILEEAVPVLDYLLQQALRRHGTQNVEGKVRIVRDLFPALNRLRDPLEQNLYVEQIAQRLGMKEAQLRDSLKRRESSAQAPVPPPARPAAPPGPVHERILLQLMLLHPEYVPVVEETLGPEGLSDPRYRKVARELERYGKGRPAGDIAALLLQLEEEDSRNLVAELLLEEERVVDADRMFQDCLRKMKVTRVQKEIHQVDEEIRQRSQLAKQNPAGASGLKELLKRKQRLVMEQQKWLGRSSAGDPRAEA